MDNLERLSWIKTTIISVVGGGVSTAVLAAFDPTRYSFPHDVGSGKLWRYFLVGAGAMFGGALLRSPLGQSAMQAYKDSQRQLEEDKAALEKAKAEFRAPPEKKEPGK